MESSKVLLEQFLIMRKGCTSSNDHGDASVDQTIRDVPHAKQNIWLGRGFRNPGCSHEVSVMLPLLGCPNLS